MHEIMSFKFLNYTRNIRHQISKNILQTIKNKSLNLKIFDNHHMTLLESQETKQNIIQIC